MQSISLRVRLGLTGIWLGVGSTFSFVVAPSAFAVLPSRELAGSIVSRVLSSVEVIGMVVGILLIILWFADSRRTRSTLEIALYFLITLAMGFSRFVVSPRLHSIRQEFGNQLAGLPSGDASRQSFDLLHRVSVGLMGFDLLAAFAALLVLIWLGAGRKKLDA